tara:strand:+ start:2816 stop:3460 length:645 start_codon:yes stop_codon:yes gene_type:complete
MKLSVYNQNETNKQLFNIPPVTLILLLINVCLYIILSTFLNLYNEIVFNFGFIPAIFTYQSGNFFQYFISPFSHIFLHADFTHILLNMIMLVTFGSIIEKNYGKKYFILLFFISAFSGILLHYFIYIESTFPVIGSSGAISGLFGGTLFLINKPKTKKNISSLRTIAFLWIGINVISGFFDIFPAYDSDSIAWAAHIGGFIVGILTTKFFKKNY